MTSVWKVAVSLVVVVLVVVLSVALVENNIKSGAVNKTRNLASMMILDPHSTTTKPRIWRSVDAAAPCTESPPAEDGIFNYDWQRKHPSKEGLLFARPTKTGSTSFSFAMIHAAKRLYKRRSAASQQSSNSTHTTICRFQTVHERATQMKYAERHQESSYLFSLLRDPNKRAVSQFFYNGLTLQRAHKKPTLQYFEQFLLHNPIGVHTTYINQLRFRNDLEGSAAVQHILQSYDFIGITERMDESLVVWSMLLGLHLEDILYLKSNEGGGMASIPGQCFTVPKSVVTPPMQSFLDTSPAWTARVKWDQILYHEAIRALDATIDSLGRAIVEQKVTRFRELQRQVEATCRPQTKFPCTDQGVYQEDHDCIEACGMPCLETFHADGAISV